MRTIPSDTKSDRIYEALREIIITGQVSADEKLNISALARDFGSSEIPVREALKRLQEHRLVRMVPYKGYFVQKYRMSELEDLWAIRSSLEFLAMDQIAARFDGNISDSIKDMLVHMDACIAQNNMLEYRKINRIFHLELCALAQNNRLLEMISDIWEEAERAQMIFKIKRERPSASMKEHYDLLDAIVRRDAQQAKEILHKHHQTNLHILKGLQNEEI